MTKGWWAGGWILAGLVYGYSQNANAAADGPNEPRTFRGPPAEALQACSGLQSGAACSFTIHEHQVTGTCRSGPQGEALACAPNRPPHLHFGPPPEAVQACSGLDVGATCNFTVNGKELNGTCRQGPEGKPAACFPSPPP
jgi:hypothetical protein